jgi:hypothetical protein
VTTHRIPALDLLASSLLNSLSAQRCRMLWGEVIGASISKYSELEKELEIVRRCGRSYPHIEWADGYRDTASLAFSILRRLSKGLTLTNVKMSKNTPQPPRGYSTDDHRQCKSENRTLPSHKSKNNP